MGRSKNIWRAYMMQCETGYIERGGTIACGVVRSLNLPREDMYGLKPEFVSEHQGRSAWLLGMLLMYNPELFDQSIWFDMVMFENSHDIGEIRHGDILDDGTILDNEILLGMREDEDETADEFFCYYPNYWSTEMLTMRPKFEEYQGSPELFMKMTEKLDAILFQLFLFTKGTSGDVRAKKPEPSRRDLRFAKIVGTTRALDVWTLHFRVATKHAPEEYLRPLLKLLEAAFKDTFRYVPVCMTVDVSDIPLDAPEDHIKTA